MHRSLEKTLQVSLFIAFITAAFGEFENSRKFERNPTRLHSAQSLALDRWSQGNDWISASIELAGDWAYISCVVTKAASKLSVFVKCPTIKDASAPILCYENCIAMLPCNASRKAGCVPDGESIFCSQTNLVDGSRKTRFQVDTRDPRVIGSWYCTIAGHDSSRLNVLPLDKILKPSTDRPEKSPTSPLNGPSNNASENQSTEVRLPKETSAFFSQEPWLFAILGIFIISLLMNVILCIRLCLVCAFAGKRKAGKQNQRALGEMLCLPTEPRKPDSILWDNDIFPGTHLNACNYSNHNYVDNATDFRRFGSLSHECPMEPALDSDVCRYPYGLYRTRSAAFVPLSSSGILRTRECGTVRSQRAHCPNNGGSHLISQGSLLDAQIPAPVQYVDLVPTTVAAQELRPDFVVGPAIADRIPGGNLPQNLSCGVTVYDDVANNTSMANASRDNQYIPSRHQPTKFLPSMAENLDSPDEQDVPLSPQHNDVTSHPSNCAGMESSPVLNADHDIYVLHSLSPDAGDQFYSGSIAHQDPNGLF